jgi:hypothetical protein
MDMGFKEPNIALGELKENSIEGVLKELQGKTLSKKSIFDLLLGIDVSKLPTSNDIPKETEPIKKHVKGNKRKGKKSKQDELSNFFDLITNNILLPKPQEEKQEPITIISEIKLEIEDKPIILPEVVNIPIDTILKTNEDEYTDKDKDEAIDTDIDTDNDTDNEIKDNISVILYPLGIKRPISSKPKEPKEPVEIKCKACKKTFTAESSLRRHYKRYPVCLDFMALPESVANNTKMDRGLHYILDELLSKSVCLNGEKECRWCKTTFTTIGNLHKHLNNSKVCNKMAIQEFKKLFLSLEV